MTRATKLLTKMLKKVMTMKPKLEIWMMGSSRIVHMSRSWQRRSRQHLEMRHWILCILMLHFEWDHMTINETCLTSFCAWSKHRWVWKHYFCKLWVFIYLKWWSHRPHSASFRVKATFPFYSTERISWNHHSPLISITESKRESGFYPEWGWLWSIRSSPQIDEHSQFVQIPFSKR